MNIISATDNTNTTGAELVCYAPAGPGSFAIPPTALLALPPGNFAQLGFRPYANPANLTGSRLTVSKALAWNVTFSPLSLK